MNKKEKTNTEDIVAAPASNKSWWSNKIIDISDADVRPEVAKRYEGFAEYVNYGI